MQKVKSIGDALQAIGGESNHNLVMTILLGLPEEYRGFVSALSADRTKPTFEQLRLLLMQEKIEVQQKSCLFTIPGVSLQSPKPLTPPTAKAIEEVVKVDFLEVMINVVIDILLVAVVHTEYFILSHIPINLPHHHILRIFPLAITTLWHAMLDL